jgi:hypothetical protein
MKQKPLFKRVTQIGLVVKSADETAKRCWEEFGLGPWTFYTFSPSNVGEMTIRGQRVDHAMRTAHAIIGEIDWEIIEPLDDRSIYAEHLRMHGEGLHHILFDVEDYADARAHLRAKGHDELTSGRWLGNLYGYFDTRKSLGCVTELWTAPPAGVAVPAPDSTYP